MKLQDLQFITDENIHPGVVEFLFQSGCDVIDIKRDNLIGSTDIEIIRKAFSENRLIITHDSDFGSIAIANGEPVTGIIYLRPGHIKPEFTIGILKELFARDLSVTMPFIIVAERSCNQIKIRVRNL